MDLAELSGRGAGVSRLEAALDRLKPVGIYHLAAQANPRECAAHPGPAERINVQASEALFEAAARHGIPVVFASSAAVYRSAPEPHREQETTEPGSPYGLMKRQAERAAEHATRELGGRVVVARAFNHSGPGQSTEYALSAFAHRLAAARSGTGPIEVGNLAAVRDFLHVDDVLDAYQVLLERGAGGTAYNVCSGVGVAMGELFERLGARFGFSAADLAQRTRPADSGGRAVEADVLIGDPGKLRELGWRPKRSLDELLDAVARPLL